MNVLKRMICARVAALAFAMMFAIPASAAVPQGAALRAALVAHAGKGYGAPENTLPGFKAIVEAGFGFECDIQMSSDHQIFAAHNGSAKAYSGQDVLFKTMQWSEIAKIDIGRRLGGPKWAGTPAPRFEDILALMRDGRKSFVEVKESAGVEIVPYIKNAVEGQSVATPENMAFISFSMETCRALRKALPKYEVLLLTLSHRDLERPDDGKGPVITADELIAMLKDADISGVDMVGDMSVVTEEYVKKVKAAGFRFCVWTVDNTNNARILFERGVDVVTTNRTREMFDELNGDASFRGVDDGRVLTNPGMGLTMHYCSNVPGNYGSRIEPGDDMTWFPGCSVCYLRLPWSMVEPEEGVFDWATIDTPAQRWIDRGGQIALRFTCSEDWMYYATPKWVEDAGAKGTRYRFFGPTGPVRTPDGKTLPWDPDFGDPVFMEMLEKFIAALAARYDGRSEVAFVDIGSYGLWGEGHTHMSSKVSEEKRAVDIRRHIDLWCKHFKKTQLVISDDVDGNANQTGKYPILDYARSKGVSWRDDSILVERPPRSWYHADQAERYWRTLPVVLEHEHYEPSVKGGAWSAKLLVESVELMHASYMSIHGPPKKLLDENREAFDRIARRLGYRFVPSAMEWPRGVMVGKTGKPFKVSFSFSNCGVAPCYADAYPCLTVKDGKGRILAVLADCDFNLKGLLPGEAKSHEATFRLGRFDAPTFPVGGFDVFVSVGKSDGTPVYELPIGDGDGHRRYRVGKMFLGK